MVVNYSCSSSDKLQEFDTTTKKRGSRAKAGTPWLA